MTPATRFECACGWAGLEARIVRDFCTVGDRSYEIYEVACPSCGEGVEEVNVCLTPDCDEPPAEGADFCVFCCARQDAEEAEMIKAMEAV